ncbi:hypothetical protein ACLOJK_010033 [Asimina triloba]
MEIRPTELLDSNQSLDKTIKEISTKPWVNAKVKILDFEILMVLPTVESLPFHEQTQLLTSAVSRGYKLSLENLDSSSDEGGSEVTGDTASSSTSTSTSTGETQKEGNASEEADKE